MENMQKRCGFVAVIGAPNAGKSTLINTVLGDKVSIVTPKAQTTRRPVLGICLHQDTQIIFSDTAGLFSPKKTFEKAMVTAAWDRAQQADYILYMVDCSKLIKGQTFQPPISNILKEHLQEIGKIKKPCSLVLNKIDCVNTPLLLQIADYFNSFNLFEEIFMISAEKNSGVKEMLDCVSKKLPLSQWHYESDQITDLSDRDFAAELTREKLFLYLRDELPYGLHVETENWQEFENGSVKITQNILLEREQHKPIVIGKNGQNLKKIGQIVRKELQEIFGREVHLFLQARHKPHYFKNKDFLNL